MSRTAFSTSSADRISPTGPTSRRSRRLVLAAAMAAAALTLSACGFRPLYGDTAANRPAVTEQLAAVAVGPVPDRAGQIYRNSLERLLAGEGRGHPGRYRLDSAIKITETGLAINEDATASRYNVRIVVSYRLMAPHAGENNADRLLADGTVTQINGYDQISAPYATLVSRQDAIERALKEAAREVHTRLSIYFDQHGEV
ncbi:LPS assembly lipoprotein LptE [Tistrella mobilis]|uniref:LPS assembly lipoprotein LptE n=1 Tax=Tistrella mobilis TaxID=171437 RepID=UPI003558CA53